MEAPVTGVASQTGGGGCRREINDECKIHSCTIEFSLNIVSLAMVFILLRWILHAMFDCFVAAITVVCCFGHNFNMLKNTLPIHL